MLRPPRAFRRTGSLIDLLAVVAAGLASGLLVHSFASIARAAALGLLVFVLLLLLLLAFLYSCAVQANTTGALSVFVVGPLLLRITCKTIYQPNRISMVRTTRLAIGRHAPRVDAIAGVPFSEPPAAEKRLVTLETALVSRGLLSVLLEELVNRMEHDECQDGVCLGGNSPL